MLVHPDQKGLVKRRNITEANRMIQDIIQYLDEEDCLKNIKKNIKFKHFKESIFYMLPIELITF
jgi:hypothetical protein